MSFVPVEAPRQFPSDPSADESAGESMLAIAGFLVALLGALISCGVYLLRLASPPWMLENLGTFIGINQFGVVIALLGAILSIAALFSPPRRLAIAGTIVGVIGGAALLFHKSPERPPVASHPPPPRQVEKKPTEEDLQKKLWELPDTDEPREAAREWTTIDGKQQRGKYLRTEQTRVLIQLADQSETAIEYKRLIPRDQRWVKKQIVPEVAKPATPVEDPLHAKRENYRNYTLVDGQVFAAKYLRRSGNKVDFEYEDGTEFSLPFNQLSAGDQKYIEGKK